MSEQPYRVVWFQPDRPVEGNTVYVRPTPSGPAIEGAAMTFEGAIYVRHEGVWVPLLVERGERVAITSPPIVEEEARRWST